MAQGLASPVPRAYEMVPIRSWSPFSFPCWVLSCGRSGLQIWDLAPFSCSHHSEDQSPDPKPTSQDWTLMSLSAQPSPADWT